MENGKKSNEIRTDRYPLHVQEAAGGQSPEENFEILSLILKRFSKTSYLVRGLISSDECFPAAKQSVRNKTVDAIQASNAGHGGWEG